MITQGEWEINGGIIEVLPAGRPYSKPQQICIVGVPNNQTKEDTDNARLISAAPDLLEACKEAKIEITESIKYGRIESLTDVLQKITAAIAKAEGR